MLSVVGLPIWSLHGPCENFLEKVCQIVYLVASSSSEARASMRGTILVAVDQHRSGGFTEATPCTYISRPMY